MGHGHDYRMAGFALCGRIFVQSSIKAIKSISLNLNQLTALIATPSNFLNILKLDSRLTLAHFRHLIAAGRCWLSILLCV